MYQQVFSMLCVAYISRTTLTTKKDQLARANNREPVLLKWRAKTKSYIWVTEQYGSSQSQKPYSHDELTKAT